MRILVDADACPVKEIIINLAKYYKIEVLMFFDSAHVYESDYAKVTICDQGKDSVDYVILNNLEKHDLVITQDYGLSALVLTKKAYVITFNGLIINNDNIDALLNSRYMGLKERQYNKHIKGPAKRNIKMDQSFFFTLEQILLRSE